MNKREAIEVGFKVLSMYAFVQGITALAVPISLRENQITLHASIRFSAAAFLPSALLFLFGTILWLIAKKTGVSSIAQESSPDSVSALTPQMLQSIIFSALGILIVVESATPLGNVVTALSVYALYHHDDRVFISPFPYYRLIEGLSKLVFGCWLIIGTGRLRRFKSWLLDNAKSVGQKDW